MSVMRAYTVLVFLCTNLLQSNFPELPPKPKTASKLYSIHTFSTTASLSINDGRKESNQWGDEYVLEYPDIPASHA